jgi:hypothetical protein
MVAMCDAPCDNEGGSRQKEGFAGAATLLSISRSQSAFSGRSGHFTITLADYAGNGGRLSQSRLTIRAL